jgi:guanylate kinase
MKKIKIVALIGESGSGKDTFMQEVLKLRPDLHEIISCTTRPIREGE